MYYLCSMLQFHAFGWSETLILLRFICYIYITRFGIRLGVWPLFGLNGIFNEVLLIDMLCDWEALLHFFSWFFSVLFFYLGGSLSSFLYVTYSLRLKSQWISSFIQNKKVLGFQLRIFSCRRTRLLLWDDI